MTILKCKPEVFQSRLLYGVVPALLNPDRIHALLIWPNLPSPDWYSSVRLVSFLFQPDCL